MTTELRRSGRSPGATRLRRFIRPADPATEATGADPAGCELCGQPLPETVISWTSTSGDRLRLPGLPAAVPAG